MRKSLILSAAVLSAFTVPAVMARVDDYRLNVQDFCELTVVDGVNVDYRCVPDSAGWAVFSCEPEMASHITFGNKAEHLVVKTDADESPIPGIPRVTVYSSSLRKVVNSGDSLLRVFADDPVKVFKIRQIGNGALELHNINAEKVDAGITAGNGHMSIDGNSDKITIRNVSAGCIDASRMVCDEVRCFVFGTGNVHCDSPGKLKVFGAGSGIVYYHGGVPGKVSNRSIGVRAMPYEYAPAGDRLLSGRTKDM